ncbi:MAG: hypothetical protein K2H09_09905 [Treponemataceae bacterium]|nr:hypothetical protein [Treponemataceae bacterium]
MEAPGRSVIGFSSANDVGFLTSACERYQLPAIQFAAYDAAAIIDSANGAHKSLADWCGHYGVDTAGLRAHRSCDDAKMTMLLLKAFCGQSGASLESVLERHKGSRLSVESYMERRAQKRHDDELMKKITELYGKKCRARLSNALDGGQYSFGFKLRSDNMEEACALAALVYKHGGMLRKRLSHSGTIILEDGQINSERTERMKAQGLSVISISGLRELVRME